MLKKVLFTSVFILSSLLSMAQHTIVFTQNEKLFHQGKSLYEQRKYTASYRSFEQFLAENPSISNGLHTEVSYYLCANAYELRMDNAERVLNDYLRKFPYSNYIDRVEYMVGILAYEKGNYTKALKHFGLTDESHLIDKEKSDLLFCKGYAYIAKGQYKKALPIFNTLTKQNSKNQPTAIYYLAYCQYQTGSLDTALRNFKIIAQKPQFAHIAPYYILQINYIKDKNATIETAAKTLIKKTPTNPHNSELYRILGEQNYNKQQYIPALKYLNAYAKSVKQLPPYESFLIGECYLQTDKPQKAISYLSKATYGRDELREKAYLQLGNAYIKADEKDNARMAFEQALQFNIDPATREEALFNYALTSYETTTVFGEAVKAFEKFIEEFPKSKHIDEAYNHMATVYLTTNNYLSAYRSINKIKYLTPKLRETKQYLEYQLGTEKFSAKHYTDAIPFFSKALKTAPNGKYKPDSYYWRAESYYRLKKYALAEKDLNTFFGQPNITLNPNYTQALYDLGYAYFSQKKYSQALSQFLKYAKIEKQKSGTHYVDAMNRIGDGYFAIRNFTKADEYYSEAIGISPYNGDYALFQMAYISGLQKDYNKKIARLEELRKKYPHSEFGDDALYEIGRSYVMMENDAKTISTYQQLLNNYSNSNLAPKALLEIGLVQHNRNELDKAIPTLKRVVGEYPGSDEARTALESLETIYVDNSDVKSYLDYTKSLGIEMSQNFKLREDSISFSAAEKQYMNGKFAIAQRNFQDFLTNYCPNSTYCHLTQYYLADCYYRSNQKQDALREYNKIVNLPGNPYLEEASIRAAEIAYDATDYESALSYFQKLATVAQNSVNKDIASLGILRCNRELKNYDATIKIATEILKNKHLDNDTKEEALINRAKAEIAKNQLNEALKDLKNIESDTRTAIGAEAKYLIAETLFRLKKLNESESEILDFAKKNSPFQYWLAKSFILLSDISMEKKEYFQAKQYLVSLQNNYTMQDDIQPMIAERLEIISTHNMPKK